MSPPTSTVLQTNLQASVECGFSSRQVRFYRRFYVGLPSLSHKLHYDQVSYVCSYVIDLLCTGQKAGEGLDGNCILTLGSVALQYFVWRSKNFRRSFSKFKNLQSKYASTSIRRRKKFTLRFVSKKRSFNNNKKRESPIPRVRGENRVQFLSAQKGPPPHPLTTHIPSTLGSGVWESDDSWIGWLPIFLSVFLLGTIWREGKKGGVGESEPWWSTVASFHIYIKSRHDYPPLNRPSL